MICTAIVFYHMGSKSAQQGSYWKGRGEGWKACEELIIYRILKSEKINLTEEEVLEELIQ
jgi:hypothetical protein